MTGKLTALQGPPHSALRCLPLFGGDSPTVMCFPCAKGKKSTLKGLHLAAAAFYKHLHLFLERIVPLCPFPRTAETKYQTGEVKQ